MDSFCNTLSFKHTKLFVISQIFSYLLTVRVVVSVIQNTSLSFYLTEIILNF